MALNYSKQDLASKLAEVQKEHPRAISVEAADEAVIMRPPTRQEYKRFRTKGADKATQPEALEGLMTPCVLWPDKAVLDQMLDDKPALADVFGSQALTLAGMSEPEAKK